MKVTIRKPSIHGMASAFAMSAVLCSAAAFAQGAASTQPAAEQAADDESGLTEIIVTAQKRSENLQKVPIAVSAVTGVALQTAAVNSSIGLAKVAPGLAINSGQGFFAPYLRGIGSQYPNLGLESSIASYADDLYISRPQAGFADFNDVARVEVLKGPQGTLFGRNTSGGAIRIISNDPVLNRFEGNAQLTYGRFQRVGVQGVINVPLGSTVAARIAYYHDERNGYINNIDPTKPKLGNRNIDMIRGKLLWEPSDSFKIKLQADYAHKRDFESTNGGNIEGAPGQVGVALGGTASPGFYTVTSDFPYADTPQWLIQQARVALRADWDIGPVTLSSITGYVWSNFFSQASELDGTDLPYQHNAYHEHSDSYSQEFQAVSNSDGPLKYIAGLYYFQEKGGNNIWLWGQFANDAIGPGFGTTFPYGPNVGRLGGGPALYSESFLKVESFAPYAQATYDFTDQLQLLVGARYTKERKTVLGHSDSLLYLPAPFPSTIVTYTQPSTPAYKFNKFTPKATLSYKPTRDVLLYVSYSVGFKSGGINAPAFGLLGTVDPENLKSYEAGWKMQFGNVRFNGSAYYYDLKNLQVQRTDLQNGGTRIENAANAQIYGLDADLTWAVTSQLELGAGGAWTHSKYKNYIGAGYVLCASAPTAAGCAVAGRTAGLGYGVQDQDFSGRSLVLAPKYSFNLRAQYTMPLEGDMGSLRLNSNFGYSAKYYYSPEQTLSEKAHKLLSASVTWESANEKTSITVFGDNLLDQKYYLFRGRTGLGGVQMAAPPLTWGVRLGVKL